MTSETPSPRLAGDLSDQAYTETRAPYFRKPVTRLLPTARMSARELFVVAHGAGGPLRTLSEVYLNWEHMLSRTNQAAWLAIAGAYVPFGLGETLCAMMRMRAFDVLVTTPAQLTHDLTEVRGLRHYHGEESANDNELQRLDINRYWNVYGDEQELNTNDEVVHDFAETLRDDRTYTSSEYFYRFGTWLQTSKHMGADGMLTTAARLGIPIFCPSPGDGDITSDLAHYRKRTGRKITIDPVREILDMVALNAALEDAGGRAGIVTLGGGAPRNYGQQAMACAYMLDRADLKRYNYGLRISLDPVGTGGLSGSTISEGKTWKKYAADTIIAEHFGEYMGPLFQIGSALLEAFEATPRPAAFTCRYDDSGDLIVNIAGTDINLPRTYGYE